MGKSSWRHWSSCRKRRGCPCCAVPVGQRHASVWAGRVQAAGSARSRACIPSPCSAAPPTGPAGPAAPQTPRSGGHRPLKRRLQQHHEHVKAACSPQPRWAQAAQGWAWCRGAGRDPGSSRCSSGDTHPAEHSPRRCNQPGEHPATCPRRGTGSGRTAPRGCSHPARSVPGSPCSAGDWVGAPGQGQHRHCPSDPALAQAEGFGVSSPAHRLHHGTLLVEAGHPQHLPSTAPAWGAAA